MNKSKIESKLINSALRRPQGKSQNNQQPCMKQLTQLQHKFASVRANYSKIFALGEGEAAELDCKQDIQELSTCLEKLHRASVERLGSIQKPIEKTMIGAAPQTLRQAFEIQHSPPPPRPELRKRQRPAVREKKALAPIEPLSLRPALRKKEKPLPVEHPHKKEEEYCVSDKECQDKRPFFNGLHPAQKVVCVTKRPRGSECVYQASRSKY